MYVICFWLQVVENAPYVTTLETLDTYNCDFCVHGGMIPDCGVRYSNISHHLITFGAAWLI